MSSRSEFALSWGRKMFFGPGWLLTSLVGLTYLGSMIIPQNFSGWFYFLLTYVGHYGVILSLIYFLFFCPVVLIFPTYYISRIWSIFLILILNLAIFLDSFAFIKYRFHLNSFLFDYITSGASGEIFSLGKKLFSVISILTFVAFVLFWIRGEQVWRRMQARFSNPVKNWYLVVIFLAFTGSHLFHMYSDAKGALNINRISQLFPLNFPLTSKGFLRGQGIVSEEPRWGQTKGYKDFYYPVKALTCKDAPLLNYVFVQFESWPSHDFNAVNFPKLWHIADHGSVFNNHLSGGMKSVDGLFSLYYSLPPAYISTVRSGKYEAVLQQELRQRNYQLLNVNFPKDEWVFPAKLASIEEAQDLIKQTASQETHPPFFINFYFSKDQSYTEKDNWISDLVQLLHSKSLLSHTVIMITGTHGQESESTDQKNIEQIKTPLILLWPSRGHKVESNLTSHYDVVPTILKEGMKCSNPSRHFSFGESLFTSPERSSHIAGTYQDLGIVDFNKKALVSIQDYKGMNIYSLDAGVKSLSTEIKILEELESLTYFFKKH